MMVGPARKDSDPGSRPKEGPAASKGNKSEAIQEQTVEGFKHVPSLLRNVRLCPCKLPQGYIICVWSFLTQ